MKNAKKDNSNMNFLLRLLSIFLAIVAWFVVIQVENPDDSYIVRNIHIDAKNPDILEKDNLIFYGFAEDTITVKFSGGKVNLGKLREYEDAIVATVDLNDYYSSNNYSTQEGVYLPITVNVPEKLKNLVKIEHQSLEYVLIMIDRKITYSADVNINMKVNVGNDYYVDQDKAKVLPQKVEITGAKNIIDQIDKVEAEVEVISTKGEINDAIVKLYDKDGKVLEGLNISPEKVQVQVPVLNKKTVKLNLDVKNTLDSNLELEAVKIVPSELVVAGSEEIIAKLADNLSISIDLENSVGNYTQSKDVILNEALVNVNDISKVNIAYTIKEN